jgi:2-polyprenyl-6-methoxyphenol hydroxylase-like FAD-dependent oxidoreductase
VNGFDAPVGVVGAGPAGLATALRLADFGVPSVLLETRENLVRQGSATCLLQHDVLEILDRFGCGERVRHRAPVWTSRVPVPFDLDPGTFVPFVNVPGSRVERALAEAVEANPSCELLLGHGVVAVTQDDEGVTVEAMTAHGPRTFRFRHLVAADGVRSTVRTLLTAQRTPPPGAGAKVPLARLRQPHRSPTSGTCESTPLGIRMRMGRVLFAGDAARPHASRGIDHGIHDADNLAWKLALVLQRHAGQDLLETYHLERRPATVQAPHITGSTVRFVAYSTACSQDRLHPDTDRRWRWARSFGLSHDRLDNGRPDAPRAYGDSPLIQDAAGDPLLGSPAPDGRVLADGEPTGLRRLLGDGFVGLCFAADTARATALIAGVRSRPWKIPATLAVVLPAGVPMPSPDPCAWTVQVHSLDTELLGVYGAARGTWWIVRPDGRLAAKGERGERFADALNTAVGAPPRAMRR